LTHEKALAAARVALHLDPGSAEAHTAVGIATLYLDLDWDRAADSFDRALAADPGYEPAHWWRAHYLVVAGQAGEALRSARAMRLQGADGNDDLASVGWLDYLAGDFGDAAAECRRALDLDPESSSAASCLMLVAGARGDELGAVDAAVELMRVLGMSAEQLGRARAMYMSEGAAAFWRGFKTSLGEACPKGTLSLVRAFIEMRRGRPSAAIAELEGIIGTRAFWAPFIAVDPAFAPLRGRPDFESLVALIRTGATA
jgi:tetratricopeptide (TPR) repeat protein